MSVSVPPSFPLVARRSLSPPRTPPTTHSRPPSATPSDESSIIDELSFDYTFDAEGNPVRLNKGSSSKSNNSSPPTPLDSPPEHERGDSLPPPYPTTTKRPASPIILNSPVRRGSLSRSESAYPVLSGAGSDRPSTSSVTAPRSFKRVASGPTSSMTPSSSYLNPPSLSTGIRARRVTMEEFKEQEAKNRKQAEEFRAREVSLAQEEKENLVSAESGTEEGPNASLSVGSKRYSPPLSSRSTAVSRGSAVLPTRSASHSGYPHSGRPLTDVPVPQRGPPPGLQILPKSGRAGRILKSSKYGTSVGSGFDRIAEVDGMESEMGNGYYTGEETDTGADEPSPITAAPANKTARQQSYAGIPNVSLSKSGTTRPRRSASLSDASAQDDHGSPDRLSAASAQQYSRPGSSLGVNARRVTAEEKERQDLDSKLEYKKYRREAEEAERRVQKTYSETQDQEQEQGRQSPSPTHLRPSYAHKRRDSDTLRSVAPPSPTAMEPLPSRHSPSGRNFPFPAALTSSVRHRRSPTAPDPPTTSMLGPPVLATRGVTWATSERDRDSAVEDYANGNGVSAKSTSMLQQQMSLQQQQHHMQQQQLQQQQHSTHAPGPSQMQAPAAPDVRSRQMIVNKRPYARLDMIGKGGSSRVYRVLNHANELYAIKRVSLDKTDADTMSGYMNEIALLKRLNGNSRIIRLIDSEVKAGPGGSKGHLLLVMECGEIDLARLLQEQQKEPMNMVWISYYWQQMLQAVHIIHEEKIVHSDLKPANFVLVRGQLKLIDFGIANAIANDTTNIQRDHQIGTVNYMSPEAIELPDGMRRLKVGRPSDVWSLGCILYQMVYGHPPFQHLSVYQKMKAIPDLTHIIEFPEHSTPSIPASKSSPQSGSPNPPKKLDHLKRRVRRDVIAGMKSCLCRNPKERSTIPELMEQDWLAMKEPEPPAVKELLALDETIINPYYMRQLLQYGIRLGQSQSVEMDPEQLLRDAERLVAELKALEA